MRNFTSAIAYRAVRKGKIAWLSLCVLFLSGIQIAKAQVATYTFSQSSGTYTEITGGTVLGDTESDDDVFNNNVEGEASPITNTGFPIGFNFVYNGVTYDKFAVSFNGWIKLGTGSFAINNSSTPLSTSTTSINSVISGVGIDMLGQAGSELSYAVIGSAPNRKLVVQWKNAKRYTTGAQTSSINFQIVLNETSNVVEVIYGTLATSATTSSAWTAEVGIKGPDNTFATNINNRRTTTDWNASVAGTSNDSKMSFNNTVVFPASGLTFKWTPPVPCTGAPVAGTVSTTLNRLVCNGSAPGVITVTGANPAVPGISYQWQESLNGTDWANATGGTGATTTSYTPPTFNGAAIQYRLKVSCSGGSDSYTDVTSISIQASPVSQASALVFSAQQLNSFNVAWTNGTGARRIVLVNSVDSFTDPVSGNAPALTASAVYAGTGQQIVYDGTGSNVTVTGLTCNTPYYVRVYEYNRCGSGPYDYYYNTTSVGNSGTTTSAQPVLATGLPSIDFTGFTGTNLSTVFPGWYEGTITTAAGSNPSNANPVAANSSWISTTAFGPTTAKINLFSNTANAWIISPKMAITASSRLKFKAAVTGYTSAGTTAADPDRMIGTDDKVTVLVSTDGCGVTWTPIYTIDATTAPDLTNELTDFTVLLSAYVGQTIQIAFQATDGPLNDAPDYDFHIGNVFVEEVPACDIPLAQAPTAITKNSATISWVLPTGTASGYQYVVSPTNTAPTGAGTPAGGLTVNVTGLPASTTHYVFVRTVCGADFSEWSVAESFTTLCEYPDVLTSNATPLCGQGTSTLTATSSGGTIQWYAAQTGGASLAEGGTFTSPMLTETTTYYVGTKGASSDVSVGPASPTAQGGTIGNQTVAWNVNFTVSAGTVLKTVDVFPQTEGQAFAIAVRTSGGTVITNYPFTTSVGGGATAQTVALNHMLEPGSYQLYITLPSGGLSRNTTGAVYPYTSAVANITGNGYDPAYFMCFYNWVFENACYSPRTAVVVNVTDAPAIAADVTEEVICAGESTELSVTSANAGYAYVWMPGNLAGAAQTVSPAATTTYTVTATDTVSGCVETATVTVTVNALPVVAAMNDMEVCEGGIQALTYAGPSGTVTLGTGTGTTTVSANNAALGPNPLQNYFGGAKQQWIYTAAELTAMGMVAGSNINSIGLNLATSGPVVLNGMVIKMKNTTVSSFASTSAWIADMMTVKTSFNHTPTTGVNTFALTTPFVWDGTSNVAIQMSYSNNNSPAASAATNTATYSATSFVSTIFYRVDSTPSATLENYSGTASYTYSQRNDVTFVFATPTQTVWAPVTDLYTDAAATVAYTGGNAGTVYTKPVAAITYTATATNTAGCSVSDQVAVTINVIAAPTVTEAAQTLCGGSTIANIAVTGTAVKWYAAATGGTALAATTVLADNTTYYASQTIDGCESVARTAVAVTVTTVAAPTVADATQEFCNSGTVAGLEATGTAIKWYDEATGGVALEGTVALTNGGTYYASQTVAGCESAARILVTVTINTPAAPTAAATLTVCNAGTVADLEATGTAGATIAWYDEATGGTALEGTVALTNGGTYYASQTIEGCESVQRTLVTVTINTPAEPTVAATQTFCDAATVADLEATGVAGASIAWYDEATGGTALEGTVALTNGGTYYASQTVTGCESTVRALVTVTISTVAAPVATVTQPTCAVATGTIVVTAPVGGEYTYSIDGTTFQADATFSAVAPGTYTVTAKNANDCVATATVTVNAAPEVPAAPVTTLTQPTCAVATGTIVVTSPIADANTYSIDGTTFGPSSTFENVVPGTYTVTVQNGDGCTATATVVINDAPAVPDAPTGDETQTITVGTAEEATIEDIIVTAAGTVTWYATAQDAIDGTDALAAGTQLTNGSTYYGTQTVGECTSTYIAVLIDLVLGKDDFGRNAFSVYPNPVRDILNISYTTEITSVTVHNLLGQQVIAKQPNATEVKVDLSGLADATYIVNVTAGNTVKTIKVVKKQ